MDDGLIDGWMDEWMTEGWMGGLKNGSKSGWIGGLMENWIQGYPELDSPTKTEKVRGSCVSGNIFFFSSLSLISVTC